MCSLEAGRALRTPGAQKSACAQINFILNADAPESQINLTNYFEYKIT
jgi:hypothetical protein